MSKPSSVVAHPDHEGSPHVSARDPNDSNYKGSARSTSSKQSDRSSRSSDLIQIRAKAVAARAGLEFERRENELKKERARLN